MGNWFDKPKNDVHEPLITTIEAIQKENISKVLDYERYAGLYKDQKIIGFKPGDWRREAVDLLDERPVKVSYNAIRACVDTLQSKITFHKPTAKVVTSGGDLQLQEKARGMEKFVHGIFIQESVYQKASTTFRDACVYGDGFLKVLEEDKKIKYECIHPSHIIIDNNGSLNGKLSEMFQVEYFSKAKLKSMFPNKKNIINQCKHEIFNYSSSIVRDLIQVYEAWSLPQGKNSNGTWIVKGRHIITTKEGVLLDEEYNEEHFPFIHVKLHEDLMGVYGIGIAEQIEGIQTELDEMVRKVQSNMDLISNPYIIKHKTSNIPDELIANNIEGKVLEWEGSIPPKVETPPAVHPQVFQFIEILWKRAFEEVGLSQLSATSRKPPGLNSGVALRTYLDTETRRFVNISRQWEDIFVTLAKHTIKLAQKLSLSESLVVKTLHGQALEAVDWRDVSLDDEQFILQVYPASSLPDNVSGKLQKVIEMIQGGIISGMEGRKLLDFPDLEKSDKLAVAPYEDLERTFEHMLSKGQYIAPIRYQDLNTGIRLGTSYLLRAKIDGVRQERLDLIDRWCQEASEILKPPQPEAQIEPQMQLVPPQQELQQPRQPQIANI